MKGVRIYVEGGGDGSSGKAAIRGGFNALFSPLKEKVRQKRLKWDVIPCGSRGSTFDDFCTALRQHCDDFVVLLVDAEGSVSKDTTPWSHLNKRDNWNCPKGVADANAHLMVQAMEAWFIADIDALKKFYGQGFNSKKLPKNIEQASPSDLETALKEATKATSKKKYHKIHHAGKLLERISLDEVRPRSSFCERLCKTIEQMVSSS